jgi:hypothetical protein
MKWKAARYLSSAFVYKIDLIHFDGITNEYIYRKAQIKCKSNPVKVWTGLEVSRRLKLPDFKIIDTGRWEGCQPYAPAAFTSQEVFLVLISVRG